MLTFSLHVGKCGRYFIVFVCLRKYLVLDEGRFFVATNSFLQKLLPGANQKDIASFRPGVGLELLQDKFWRLTAGPEFLIQL